MVFNQIYSDVVEIKENFCNFCENNPVLYVRPRGYRDDLVSHLEYINNSGSDEDYYRSIWIHCEKKPRDLEYESVKRNMDSVLRADKLGNYLFDVIMPIYARLDVHAHGLEHIYYVLNNILEIAKEWGLNLDIVKAIAVCHDIGQIEGREKHAEYSAIMFSKDEFFKEYFSEDTQECIIDAIRNHRSSSSVQASSIYVDAIREADRSIKDSVIFSRYYDAHFGMCKPTKGELEIFVDKILQELCDRYLGDTAITLPLGLTENLGYLVELRRNYLELPRDQAIVKVIETFYTK